MFDRFTQQAMKGRRGIAGPGIAVPNAALTGHGLGSGRAAQRLALSGGWAGSRSACGNDRHVGHPRYRLPTPRHSAVREGRVQ